MEHFTRQQLYPCYPLNKRLGMSQRRAGLLEKTEVPRTYYKLIVLRQMYSVLIIFLYNLHQQNVGCQNYILTLGLAATGIISLHRGLRIIVCCGITNMSKVCCMPTVFGINYDSVLAVATKPMDKYFCWVLGVESRFSQVVGVIDQQSARRGAPI